MTVSDCLTVVRLIDWICERARNGALTLEQVAQAKAELEKIRPGLGEETLAQTENDLRELKRFFLPKPMAYSGKPD